MGTLKRKTLSKYSLDYVDCRYITYKIKSRFQDRSGSTWGTQNWQVKMLLFSEPAH